MDASSASITKSLGVKNRKKEKAIIIASFFAIFQTIMPIIGYFLGNIFSSRISIISKYIAFILLLYIGINMIINKDEYNTKINFKELIILSIATSIDALIMGITFSFLRVNILISSLIIGIITFIMCTISFLLGSKLNIDKKKSQILGGIILIILGIKSLF